MRELKILSLADLHYINKANHVCPLKDRKAEFALEFLRRVLSSVDIEKIDLLLLLGDLADNGKASGAEEDLAELAMELKKTNKPVIAVPGNHDVNPEKFFKIFNCHEGLYDIEGYQFVAFYEEYGKGDIASRTMDKMETYFSKIDSSRPVIVLQHNPIYPPIDSPYPYNLQNAREVMEFYSNKNVSLSISGHAHWGIPPSEKDNVGYVTCPALCEEPYKYLLITMNGKKYDITEQCLIPAGK